MKLETTTGHASESGHWYDRDGKPVYDMRGANGNMRPVTLRDARKYGWLPGFSSIAAMEHKPQLEKWKIDQALMAAVTLPRYPHETDDAFIVRAKEDSKQQARKAADRGTRIHTAIQRSFEGEAVEPACMVYVDAVKDYLRKSFGECEWQAEGTFAHELGYGGKCDLRSERIIIDFKCKDFTETEKLAWPEQCMQLVSYGRGFGMLFPEHVNLFVSTREPGLVHGHYWTQRECEDGWDAFQCLLRLWQIRRGYMSAFTREKVANG
jgi:hypothetical protein